MRFKVEPGKLPGCPRRGKTSQSCGLGLTDRALFSTEGASTICCIYTQSVDTRRAENRENRETRENTSQQKNAFFFFFFDLTPQ